VPETLVIDAENLRALATDLGTIHSTLEDAETDSRALAGMIPHDRLSGAIRDFATQWDRRRAELTEQADALGRRTAAVADAFEQVDLELATRIEVSES